MPLESATTLQQDEGVRAVSVGSGGAPAVGGGGGVTTWDGLGVKPFSALGRGVESVSDSLQADLGAELSFDDSDQIKLTKKVRTDVRASGNATDTALATEQGIREAVEASSAEVLNELGDVRLDKSTLYQTSHVLAGDGSDEFTDKTIGALLGEAVVRDLGNVSEGAGTGAEGEALLLGDPDGDGALEWIAKSVSEQIRDDGELSIGDVSIASSNNTTVSDTAPSNPEDGDIWIDTSQDPDEAKVYRNGQWNPTATAIAGSNIVTSTITANEIDAETITADEISAGTITASEISAGAITASEIAAGSITANEITADTITADEISAGTITANLIDANTITATEIEAGTITGDQISGDTITGTEINADSVRTEIFRAGTGTILNTLEIGDTSPFIKLDGANGRIESSNFASGQAGFRINKNGFIEAENARIRGELRSTVVTKEEVTVVGGSEIVTPGAKVQAISAGDTTFVAEANAFDVGDTVRFKDSRQGTTEELKEVSSETNLQGGQVEYAVSSQFSNDWPTATVAHRWESRIVQESSGSFAPYTSYVSDQDNEIARIGNVSGLSGLEGFGVALGKNNNLTYDSSKDELSVEGNVKAKTGKIAGFDIIAQGIKGDEIMLSERSDALLWVDPGTFNLTGQIKNNNFDDGPSNWDGLGSFPVEEDVAGNYVDLSKVGKFTQTGIDASGAEGDPVQFIIRYKQSIETGDVEFSITDSSGSPLQSKTVTLPEVEGGPPETFSISFTVPSQADDIGIQVGPTGPGEYSLYSVRLEVGEVKARLERDLYEVYDETGSTQFRIDAANGIIQLDKKGGRIYSVEDGIRIETADGTGETFT